MAGSTAEISTAAGVGPLRRLRTAIRGNRARIAFGIAYGIAALITAIGVWLVAAAPSTGGGGASTSLIVFVVLLLNLLLIGVLAALVGLRVLGLVRQRRDDAGVRLHLRFVTLFSMVAVVPAVLVALVFGVLVNRGVEAWFSQNVRAAVETSADTGRAYVEDVVAEVQSKLPVMAREIEAIQPVLDRRLVYAQRLAVVGEYLGYPALYLLDAQGRVVARAEAEGAPAYLAPSPQALEAALVGEDAPLELTSGPDAARVLYRLPTYGEMVLYAVRPLRPDTLQRLRDSEQSILAYRTAEESRARLQATFLLAYFETALLVLVGAVWLGLSAANAISAPVARLVQAAQRVATGDLTARVDSGRDPAEIAGLSNAFNRMTEDLQVQQEALRAASEEAQARSRFIETVLSGVSAGVVGLNAKGRISATNEQALRLLGLGSASVIGQPLAKVAPELKQLADEGDDAEAEVDITRDGEVRRLRVRASGRADRERVLTFDDITRLVTAQRNAAWKDVARRIAHEIKNPLTPIQLSAERLRRKYRDQVSADVETFDRCTDTIIRQVGDIGRMVDEFSAFARMPTPQFAHENAAELLRQAVFAQRVALPDTPVELIEPLAEVSVVCDGRMIGQALTNVLKNGGEAVAARRLRDGTDQGGLRAWLDVEADQVVFVIEDDGIGLPDKDRDRLMEPYVTTREKGTGLGLAIVRRILEDHGGDLSLGDAQKGSGARVCLTLPINARPAPAAEALAEAKRETTL